MKILHSQGVGLGTRTGEGAGGGWQVPAGQVLGCAAVLQKARGGAWLLSIPEGHRATRIYTLLLLIS